MTPHQKKTLGSSLVNSNMELIEIKDDATVVVKLMGACSDCSMSMMTLKAGLEESVKKAAPEVKEVVALNMAEIS